MFLWISIWLWISNAITLERTIDWSLGNYYRPLMALNNSGYLPACMSASLSLSVFLCLLLFVNLSVWKSPRYSFFFSLLCLSIRLFVYLSVCNSHSALICLSAWQCLYVCMYVCLYLPFEFGSSIRSLYLSIKSLYVPSFKFQSG